MSPLSEREYMRDPSEQPTKEHPVIDDTQELPVVQRPQRPKRLVNWWRLGMVILFVIVYSIHGGTNVAGTIFGFFLAGIVVLWALGRAIDFLFPQR